MALQEEPGSRPPLCDVVYGLETLTVEGMHRVTGILEYRFGDRRVSDRREPDTGNGPGAERAAGDDATMSQGIGLALHTFPAPITGPEEAEIRALATGLLDLVGYEFGYAFTRIARTEQGPRVLDAVPRQASWPASRLIELTTGLVAERELVHALSGKPLKAAMPVGYAAAVPCPIRPERLGGSRHPRTCGRHGTDTTCSPRSPPPNSPPARPPYSAAPSDPTPRHEGPAIGGPFRVRAVPPPRGRLYAFLTRSRGFPVAFPAAG